VSWPDDPAASTGISTGPARRADRDDARPSIEFYRRHDLIELLLPVA
jgi:hypothetical protein